MKSLLKVGLLAVAMMVSSVSSSVASEMWLTIDQVRIYNMKQPVGSIVIGNPSIADVQVQSSEQLLFYGKAPGLTNIYLFDQDGNQIDNLYVRVKSDTQNMLVLYRGAERTTYSCTQNCEATLTIGDSVEVFGAISGQTGQKLQGLLSGGAGD